MAVNNATDSMAPKLVDERLSQQAAYRTLFHQTRQHFSHYFLQYAIDYSQAWEWLEREHGNLFAAIQSCRDAEDYASLIAFRDALQLYLDRGGHWTDSLRLNEWAIAAARTCGDRGNVVRFTHDCADILHQQGDYRQAEQLYEISEQLYLELNEREMALRSRHMRTLVIRARGQIAKAEQLCQATITEAQHLDLQTWLAHPLYVQALLARDRGDFQQARLSIETSLERLVGSNEVEMIAQCYYFLGKLALLQGQLTEAHTELEKSLSLSQEVGSLRRLATTQALLGDIAHLEENYDKATHLFYEAFEVATQLGEHSLQARVLLSRARLAMDLRREKEALSLCQSARALYQKIGDPRGVTATLLLLTWIYLKRWDFGLAIYEGINALKEMWKAGLLQPSVLVGNLKRRGRW